MKRDNVYHWTYKIIRSGMILFWLYVGMDKMWIHDAFELSLAQQPFIGAFAPILSWLMPLLEISLAILLFMPNKKLEYLGWKLSLLLILVFSIYIALGVFGVLNNAPCMCSSFLTNVNWITHLWINGILFILSLIAFLLSNHLLNKNTQYTKNKYYRNKKHLFHLFIIIVIGHAAVLSTGRANNAFDDAIQIVPLSSKLVDGLPSCRYSLS